MIRTDPSIETIKTYVEKNSLHRNSFLESLIKIVLSCEDGRIIDIDGDWGSGKTVLVKELELLVNEKNIQTPEIEQKYIESLRDDYSMFYYNAWENDQYDPAESVIFSLISRYWGDREKISDDVLAFAKTFTTNLINIVSLGLCDCKDIPKNKMSNNLLPNLKMLNAKKEAASDLVANALTSTSKKHMLFIIDELDRCNPLFAVKLIETIKHYFAGESVKVLFVTNNKQLAKIISSNYGNNFDGYEYLNKIFDLILNIPSPNINDFINANCDLEDCHKDAIAGIAKYYKMSLREIEKYITLYEISIQYINSRELHMSSGPIVEPLKFFSKFLLIPFILGAKIKNIDDFDAITSWGESGRIIFDKAATGSDYIREIARRCSSQSCRYSISSLYGQFMVNTGKRDSEIVETVRNLVRNMNSMLYYYGSIDNGD